MVSLLLQLGPKTEKDFCYCFGEISDLVTAENVSKKKNDVQDRFFAIYTTARLVLSLRNKVNLFKPVLWDLVANMKSSKTPFFESVRMEGT